MQNGLSLKQNRRKKLKLTFDQLQQEMELEGNILSTPADLSAIAGGSSIEEIIAFYESQGFIFEQGDDGNFYGAQVQTLDTATITGYSNKKSMWDYYRNPGNALEIFLNQGGILYSGGSGYYSGSAYMSSSSYSGGSNNSYGTSGSGGNGNLSTSISVLGLSFQNGLAWQEFYVNANKLANGSLNTNISSIMQGVFQNATSLKSDVLSLLSSEGYQGIKIIDSAGKILGVAGVVDSSVNLYRDIMDGGNFSWMNLADFGVNVGSVAIKSNIVGFTISAGWLVIKSYYDSANN